MRNASWALIAVLGATACQNYLFAPAPKGDTTTTTTGGSTTSGTTNGGPPTTTTQTFSVAAPATTDILFVIDSSGSMQDKQDRLAANANAFIINLVKSGDPFRIGIITTDPVDTKQQGRLNAFGTNGPLWLDAPASTDPQLAADQQALINSFVTAVKAVGTNGDGHESGLAAALDAVGVGAVSIGSYNAGFLRSNADLAVIVLSDEDDCSRTTTSLNKTPWTQSTSSSQGFTDENCYTSESDLMDPNAIVAALASVKGGDITRVRTGVIIAGLGTSDGGFQPTSCLMVNGGASNTCGCWTWSAGSGVADTYCEINDGNGQQCSLPQNLDPSCNSATSCIGPSNTCIAQCSAMGGYRYYAYAQALSAARVAAGSSQGIVTGSICIDSFGDELSNIASNVVAPNCFQLDAPVAQNAKVAVSVQNSSGSSTQVAWLAPGNPDATCQTCGGCPNGAFSLSGSQSVCLACGLYLTPGTQLKVTVTTP